MISKYLHETITRAIHGSSGLLHEIEQPAPKRTSADLDRLYYVAQAQLTTTVDFLDALNYSGKLDDANYRLYMDQIRTIRNNLTEAHNGTVTT